MNKIVLSLSKYVLNLPEIDPLCLFQFFSWTMSIEIKSLFELKKLIFRKSISNMLFLCCALSNPSHILKFLVRVMGFS